MESHLSHSVLAYFRSHHEDQSWLAALTLMLDASALLIAGMDSIIAHQAHLTFAIARGAAMDLCQAFDASPQVPERDRLQPSEFATLYDTLKAAGVPLATEHSVEQRLADLRGRYEPFISALSELLLLPLPPWIGPGGVEGQPGRTSP